MRNSNFLSTAIVPGLLVSALGVSGVVAALARPETQPNAPPAVASELPNALPTQQTALLDATPQDPSTTLAELVRSQSPTNQGDSVPQAAEDRLLAQASPEPAELEEAMMNPGPAEAAVTQTAAEVPFVPEAGGVPSGAAGGLGGGLGSGLLGGLGGGLSPGLLGTLAGVGAAAGIGVGVAAAVANNNDEPASPSTP